MRFRIAAFAIAAAAGFAGGHGVFAADAAASPSPATSSTPIVVEMKNFAFVPTAIAVPVGARVTFVNRDGAGHTATANDRSWDTGNLDQEQSKTLSFPTAGVFTFVCLYHPNMRGSLTVGRPAPAGSPTPAPAPTPNGGY